MQAFVPKRDIDIIIWESIITDLVVIIGLYLISIPGAMLIIIISFYLL